MDARAKGIAVPAASRGDRKRAEIVAAAERLFLGEGYGATSMDRIAAEAGASKRTVYNHFGTKEDLFRAVVEPLYATLLQGTAAPPTGGDPAGTLRSFAGAVVRHLSNPRLQALIRLVIAEGHRFPEVASIYFSVGKEPTVGRFASWLAAESEAGRLSVDDPTLAALQFLGSIKDVLFWPRMFGLEPHHPVDVVIDRAVTGFLATYGRTPPAI